jgi:hypothetical protein
MKCYKSWPVEIRRENKERRGLTSKGQVSSRTGKDRSGCTEEGWFFEPGREPSKMHLLLDTYEKGEKRRRAL